MPQTPLDAENRNLYDHYADDDDKPFNKELSAVVDQYRRLSNGNLTCDICEYQHPKPDKNGIVIECDDGIRRCKVCRGDGPYPSQIQKDEASNV